MSVRPWLAAGSALWFGAVGGALLLACTFELEEPLDRPIGSAGGGAGGGSSGGGTGGTGMGGTTPTGPCTPGETADVGECERCGRSISVCGSNSQWQEPTCEEQGVCTPGEEQTDSCPLCGTVTSTCTDQCVWGGWGDCQNQGVCSPGDTRDASCDPCSQETCDNQCAWGSCELKPGNDCEYQDGNNWQYCGPPDHWQFCSSSCTWYSCQPM